MKRIIYGISAMAAIIAVVYFMGAFCAWNLNAGQWDAPGRFVVAFLGLAFGGLAGAYIIFEVEL